MGILLGVLTFVLILVSLFLILVVLAQKSKDGGMGTALGGGAAEAAFGAETNTVLSKATIYSSVLFFILAFALYLGRIYERNHAHEGGNALPTIAAPATPLASPTTQPLTPLTPGGAAPTTTAPATAAPTTSTPAPAATTSASGATTATPTAAKP